MRAALLLASPAGRVGRVIVGVALAMLAGPIVVVLGWGWIAFFLVFMLGAEIAVGGALNVCILCPLGGLPFQGRRLRAPGAT